MLLLGQSIVALLVVSVSACTESGMVEGWVANMGALAQRYIVWGPLLAPESDCANTLACKTLCAFQCPTCNFIEYRNVRYRFFDKHLVGGH